MGNQQTYLLYASVLIITSLIVEFSKKVSNISSKRLGTFIFYISIIFPLVIAAKRYGIGTDYFNYINIYNQVVSENNILDSIQYNKGIEPGWILLNYIVKNIFNNNTQYIFVISSLIILVVFFKSIFLYRDRIDIGLATFIFFCTYYFPSFNIIRQMLAASIVFYSYRFFESKKAYKYILCIILACCFHYSAAVFFPLYYFLYTNTNAKVGAKKLILFLFFILFVIYFQQITEIIFHLNDALMKYSSYNINTNSKIGFGNIIIRLPIIVIITLNLNIIRKEDRFIYNICVIYYLSLILMFLGYKSEYASRIAVYFEMSQIYILSFLVRINSNILPKIIVKIIITLYFIIFLIYSIGFNNFGGVVPYLIK